MFIRYDMESYCTLLWLPPHEQRVQLKLHGIAHSLVGNEDRKDMTSS